MGRDESQNNISEESSSTLKRIGSNLYFLFCGSEEMDPTVNRLLVFNTYFQISELIHVLIMYTWLNKTNNILYYAIQSVLSGSLFAVGFIPRANYKHYGLLLTFIIFLLLTIAASASFTLLVLNYFTFTNYCNLLSNYSKENTLFKFEAKTVCENVANLYLISFGVDAGIILLRVIYLYLNSKAYKTIKRIFDQEQKKKRRSQKFDQKEKNKTPYDPNRKI